MKYWIQVLLIDTLYFRKTVFDNCFNIYGFYFSSPPPLISTHTANWTDTNCWMLVTSRDLYDIWLQHCTPYPGQLFLWWDFRCSKVSSGANSPTLMVSINKSTNDYCVSNFISSFHVFRPWKKEVNRYWMDGWRDGWMDGWVRMHAYH